MRNRGKAPTLRHRLRRSCLLAQTLLVMFQGPLTVAMSSHATQQHMLRIAEPVWRQAATQHSTRIRQLLQPGLTDPHHVLNSGMHRRRQARGRERHHQSSNITQWTALDPKHPVYNFLIEYYGLKGVKGPKRLARWSPNPAWLLMLDEEERISSSDALQDLVECSPRTGQQESFRQRQLQGGILLEGATEEDLGSVLHLRGAMPMLGGMCYSPAMFFHHHDTASSKDPSTPYLWYRAILSQTLSAEPVLHCHGLHEWAMQYHPEGAEPPPSAKYQSHLPLRVSRDVINTAVERRGVSCTHVDALRYFAPAAGPLNHHGASLQRTDQLTLEQPACVHAHMDLLKMTLKLQPFVDTHLLQRVLDIALQARRLDVAASPYDASKYGVGVVPVETKQGRAQYRQEQTALMNRAEPIRRDLLRAYDVFLEMAFAGISMSEQEASATTSSRADPERYAKAEPGGMPWRRNLVDV